MPIHNNDVAEIFQKTADLLAIQNANQFRVRAYRNAARTIKGLGGSISDMVKNEKDLTELSGIGKDLAGKIKEIVETGAMKYMEDLTDEIPETLLELLRIKGMGPNKVRDLYNELGIKNLADLREAIDEGKIKELEGFGEKTSKKIESQLDKLENEEKRYRLDTAEPIVRSLTEYLEKEDCVGKVITAGSWRRRKETVGDLDILVTCDNSKKIMDHYTNFEDIKEIISKGETKSSVILRSGIQVDLRVLKPEKYGAALIYFTGSKAHNVAIRKIAVNKDLKLSEYGLFDDDDNVVAAETEEEVYEKLGMAWVPPELREDRGEVKAAQNGNLPKLITLDDIRGDLHAHTKATDGKNTIEEMIRGAKDLGYEYVAITDHTERVSVAGGLNGDEMLEHFEEIDKAAEKIDGIKVLKGAEVDILKDGSLDLPDKILKKMDFVTGSVHYNFNMSREDMTERIIKAMNNEYFRILGHPTGRQLNIREGYRVDMEKILDTAADLGRIMEINAHPVRLDLNDVHCRMAKERGVKIVINTDAHQVGDFKYMKFGVSTARRGWLEKDNVINTLGYKELMELF